MTRRLFAALTLMILPPRVAEAQVTFHTYIGPWDYGTHAMAETSFQNILTQQMGEEAVEAERDRERKAPQVPSTVPSRPAVSARSLRFTPSPQRRQANLAGFVARTRAHDPAGAQQMEQLFASTDIIDRIGTALAPMGLRVDNLADAYTTYWITAWHIAHGQGSNPTSAQMQAVKRQVEQAMVAIPQMVSVSDAEKQQTAEAFLTQSALVQAAFDEADVTQRRQLAAAVRQGAKAAGFDLDAMQLTATGFVKR